MESQGVPLLGGEKDHEIYPLIDLWYKAPKCPTYKDFPFFFFFFFSYIRAITAQSYECQWRKTEDECWPLGIEILYRKTGDHKAAELHKQRPNCLASQPSWIRSHLYVEGWVVQTPSGGEGRRPWETAHKAPYMFTN